MLHAVCIVLLLQQDLRVLIYFASRIASSVDRALRVVSVSSSWCRIPLPRLGVSLDEGSAKGGQSRLGARP